MTENRFRRMTVGVFVSVVGMLVVAVAASTFGVSAKQAPVGDGWVDDCDEARTVSPSGTYNGTIDTPDDVDVFGVKLPKKGAYVTVQPMAPTTESLFSVNVWGSVSVANTRLQEGVFLSPGDPVGVSSSDRAGMDNSSFAIFAEQPGQVCFVFFEDDVSDAMFPYEWQVTLTFNAPGETTPPGQILSAEEAAQYRQDLRTLSERVAELEATVEDLDQRVADLEAELANETATGDDDPGT